MLIAWDRNQKSRPSLSLLSQQQQIQQWRSQVEPLSDQDIAECAQLILPNACVRPLACEERIAPGNHMRAGDDPKLLGRPDPHEPHEVLHVTFVRPPRLLVADVPKP